MLGVLRAAIPGAAFAQTWPTLVSLWTFDETSAAGGVFADSGPASVPMSIVGTWADLSTASMVQGIGGTSAYTNGSGHATIPADDPEHDLSELTISFYYQRNSAAAKHILLAAGDGTQAGDFSIEVLANGRLRGYHVGQDGVLRFFESGSGITGTDLQVGTAHRIDLTLGSLGARIYLDGAPLISAFILANTNGWNNTRIKYLGIFPQVELGGQADGAFDGLRIWDQQLNSAQIATLEPARSIDIQASDLAYTVPAAPSGPAAGAIYVATTGNDISGNGSIGSPYKTLAKAISVAPGNNGEIVLRKGIYRDEANLNAGGKTNLTIKGYRDDILADPLNQDNWPIIDGSFTGITWELFNAGRNEWRTTSTGHGSDVPQGMATPGTGPYQLPRWEPLGGMRVPTKVYRLYSYFTPTGARGETSFRHTGTVGFEQYSVYHGPGVWRASDGRIHIRLQGVDPSYNGGVSTNGAQTIDPFTDRNPNNNQIWLWQRGKTLFSSIGSGFTFEGIMERGYDKFFWGTQSNVTIRRSVLWGCDYYFGHIGWAGNVSNWTLQHNIFEIGFTDWTPYNVVKNSQTNGGFNYGQLIPVWGISAGTITCTNIKFLDNMMPAGWALIYVALAAAGSDFEFGHNACSNRDDFTLIPPRVGKQHYHHNYIDGPFYGIGTTGDNLPPADQTQFFSHHNLVINNRMYLFHTANRTGHSVCTVHGSGHGQAIREYYNTYVGEAPTPFNQNLGMTRPHVGGWRNLTNNPNYSFNNIFTWYVQVPPGGSSPGNRYNAFDFAPTDTQRRWFSNGNGYWGVQGPGVTGAHQFWNSVFPGTREAGGAVNFANLAAWKASAIYTNTGSTGWNFGGRKLEEDSIQADPQFSDSNAITQDARYDQPPGDYRPGNAAYQSGAIDITSFGWPGATTYQAWRGALDPNGDGSEIGPRPAV
jgi:Concanavalin A-like lectin/glucanases superfamily